MKCYLLVICCLFRLPGSIGSTGGAYVLINPTAVQPGADESQAQTEYFQNQLLHKLEDEQGNQAELIQALTNRVSALESSPDETSRPTAAGDERQAVVDPVVKSGSSDVHNEESAGEDTFSFPAPPYSPIPIDSLLKKLPHHRTAQELADSLSGWIWAIEIRNEADVSLELKDSTQKDSWGLVFADSDLIEPNGNSSISYMVTSMRESNLRNRYRIPSLGFDFVYGVYWPLYYSFGMKFLDSEEPMPDFSNLTLADGGPGKGGSRPVTISRDGYTATATLKDVDYKYVIVITISHEDGNSVDKEELNGGSAQFYDDGEEYKK